MMETRTKGRPGPRSVNFGGNNHVNSVNFPVAKNKNRLCKEQRDGRFKGTVQQFSKTPVLCVQRHVESLGDMSWVLSCSLLKGSLQHVFKIFVVQSQTRRHVALLSTDTGGRGNEKTTLTLTQ